MKRSLATYLAAIFMLFFVEEIAAQSLISASAVATAVINLSIEAQETSQLSFGRFHPGNTGGSITILPSGTVEATSGIVVDAGTKSPGGFIISGESKEIISMTFPDIITLSDGESNLMTVSNWVSSVGTSLLLEERSETVTIGATLNVGSLEQNPKGVYTGTYQITFFYN